MKMVKKIMMFILAGAVLIASNLNIYGANNEVVNSSSGVLAIAKMTNLDSGESVNVAVRSLSTKAIRSADNTYTASCEVYFPIEDNNSTRDMESSTKNAGGVTATINIVYTLNAQQDKINVTRCYGGWVPDNGLYYTTNRQVYIVPGLFSSVGLRAYPNTDSFDYSIDWGYLLRQPEGDYQQQARSFALIYVGSMEHAGGYELEVELYYGGF